MQLSDGALHYVEWILESEKYGIVNVYMHSTCCRKI